jgi:hypothetical protein
VPERSDSASGMPLCLTTASERALVSVLTVRLAAGAAGGRNR